MKKWYIDRVLHIALLCLFVSYASGCSSNSSKGPLQPVQPNVASIAVSGTTSLVAGQSQQLTATAKYSDGSTKDVSATATWTSSAPSVATVTSSGNVTAVANGQATITASFSGISGTAALTVSAALQSVVVAGTTSLAVGQSQQLTATAKYSDGTTKDVSATASWTSSAPSIATVSSNGNVTAVSNGQSVITASFSGTSGTATLTVSPALQSIAVSGTTSLVVGQSQQLTATATYSDGTTKDVTASTNWSSSAPTIASVSSGGTVTAVSAGLSTITASFSGISGTASLTVNAKAITSIDVYPNPATLAIGVEQQLSALATFNDGSTSDITSSASWSSSAGGIASVSAKGVVAPLVQGTATITASSGTVSGATAITVPDATGGLIANINLTDPLLAYGTEQNGNVDSFFGVRDSNGTPLSFYGFSSQSTDGTIRTLQFDQQQRVVHATSSEGIVYDIQWLSPTTGNIDVSTTKGTPTAVSAYFDLSSTPASNLHQAAKSVVKTGLLRKANDSSPNSSSLKISAKSDCLSGQVLEPHADVNVSVTGSDGEVVPFELPQSNGDGTFMLQLPSNSVASSMASVEQSLSSLLNTQCQETQSAGVMCTALNSLLSKLAPNSDISVDCPLTLSGPTRWCSPLQSFNSFLNRFTAVQPLTISAEGKLDGYLGSGEVTAPPATSLDVQFSCETPTGLEVHPGPDVSIPVGSVQSLRADLTDNLGTLLHSAAFSIEWTQPSGSSDFFLFDSATTQPEVSTDVTAIKPTTSVPVTVAVQSPYTSTSFVQPVTLQISVSGSITVTPSTATVSMGETGQFTATETGVSNPDLTWSVNGTNGGNSTIGWISPSGLYTAPATPPNPSTVTVTATDQANSSVSGSAAVTIAARGDVWFQAYDFPHAFPTGAAYTVNGYPIPTTYWTEYGEWMGKLCNVPVGKQFTLGYSFAGAGASSAGSPSTFTLSLLNLGPAGAPPSPYFPNSFIDEPVPSGSVNVQVTCSPTLGCNHLENDPLANSCVVIPGVND